jgi:hypothetical protein
VRKTVGPIVYVAGKKLFFGWLECVGHSFASVAHFVFLRDVWIEPRAA